MSLSSSLFSSNSDEWSTPDSLFNVLDAEFHFTLDPCSSDLNFKCFNHFTIFDDGLKQDWSGNVVFCNPPYSNIYDWAKKCYFESLKAFTTVVFLVPSRTDTKWFHEFVYPYCELRFIKGRLRFNNADNAPFPSMICIWR